MLHLDEAALQGLNITAGDCIAMLERLITAAGQGRAFSAPKSVLTPPDGRYVMSTLAMMDDPPLMATKSLILNDANRAKGLLPINALVSVSCRHGRAGAQPSGFVRADVSPETCGDLRTRAGEY